jgi:nucleoside-diphosphate-sugar epimerase
MPKTVVITGAAGNLGRKLRTHLAIRGYTLRLLDVAAKDDTVNAADLAVWSESWARSFEGADAVVHLVGAAVGDNEWRALVPAYVDATLNVIVAAARAGVPRLVYASSVWTMAAQRFAEGPITADPAADPGVNAYGAAKLFGERTCRALSEAYGLSAIALRIGACRAGENDFSTRTPMGDWNQNCWLSNRDFVEGVERAIEAEIHGFAVVNLVSGNPGSRWTLDEAFAAIGFRPKDGERAQIDARSRLRARIARFAHVTVPRLMRSLAPPDW